MSTEPAQPEGTVDSPYPPGAQLLRLLQISSSLCPIGAFAFSQGLEHAVERGWVRDEGTLAEWLIGLGRHGLARLDLPLLLHAHGFWKHGEPARALALCERVLANREARELREQEQELGAAFALFLGNLGVADAAPLEDRSRSCYVVGYALGAVHFGIPAEVAAHGFAFAWSEQQANAAARLVPLGHRATQRVLSRVLGDVPGWIEQARSLREEEIGSSAPGLALAAAWHETQYTRLFRS